MPSAWIQHVKNYASHHNITYKEALKLSKPSYSLYGTVSTDPSMIKFNLNDDQYNLTAFKINPAFRKGEKTTHNVNVKYKSDETINKETRQQSNIYNVNEIIEPTKTRNKFIINEAKHKKNIQKIEAKYAKIKNTDMSKYLNKKPVTIKPNEPKKNDSFSFLYEPTSVEIPKVSFSAPYNKLAYEEGIVPYTNIILPKFKSPDEEINIYNTMIIKYQNLVVVLLASKMPEDDKEILMNECRENIKSLKDKILKIKGEHTSDKPIYSKFEKVKRPARKLPTSDYTKAQREQAQMGMEDINVNAKPVNKKTQVPIIQDEDQNEEIEADDKKLEKKRDKHVTTLGQNKKEQDIIDDLIKSDYPISSLPTNFKTKNQMQRYFIGLQNKIIEKKKEITKSNSSLKDRIEQHKKYDELQTKLDKYVDILSKQFLTKKKKEKNN